MGNPKDKLDPESLIGRQFGSYEILSRIASGGMGTVYRAQHTKLAKIVAVKVLAGNMAAVDEYVLRFEREAQLAARLEHPNIVRIYDYGSDGEVIYLVMQFVEGESLAARMKRDKKLPILEAMHITREIAKGLDIAHENGLVHRDIKPDNILISKRNEIMITDFGLVKLDNEQDGPDQSPIETVDSSVTAELTIGGSILGTPYYMSPEQCQGLPDIDARADLYSLGLILYGLLTGQVPAEGKNAMMIMQNRLLYDPTPPINLNPAIGEPLNDLVLHLLQREPQDRLATARLLVQRLNGLFPVYARQAKGRGSGPRPRPRQAPPQNMGPPQGRPPSGPMPRPPSGPAFRPPPPPRAPSPPPMQRPAPIPTGPPPNYAVSQSGEMAFTDYADGGLEPTPVDNGPRPVFVQPPLSPAPKPEKFRNFYESDDRPPPPPPAPVEEPGLEGFRPLPSNVSLAPKPKSQQELDEYYQPAPPAPELTPMVPEALETQSITPSFNETNEAKTELPSYMRALDTNIPPPPPAPEIETKPPRKFPKTLFLLFLLVAVASGAYLYLENQEKPSLDFLSISETPEWTNKREIEIRGQLNQGSLKVKIGDDVVQTDDDGFFTQLLSLRTGRNEFIIEATNQTGESTIKTLVIMFDDTPPKLYFESLFRGKLFLDTKKPILVGEIREKNPKSLLINEKELKFDKNGLFNATFDGEIKKVQISVIDLAGNKSTKNYSIVYRPAVEFKDFKAPDEYTNVQKHVISGIASRFPAKLRVNNSKVEVGEKGAFKYPCTLRNGKNNFALRIQANDGGVGVKNLIIIYDAKAPTLTLDRVFGEKIFLKDSALTGKAKDKYLAKITVNGADIKKDAFGAFSVNLKFEGKDSIPVKVVAKDRAGNSTELNYEVFSNKYRGWIIKPPTPEFVVTDSYLIKGQFSVGELFVAIGDNKIRADKEGRFQLKVPLKMGANKFKLIVKLPDKKDFVEDITIERRAP